MDPKIAALITNARKVIVITSTILDLDDLYSAFALTLALDKMGRKVRLFISRENLNPVIKSKLSPRLENILEENNRQSFKISLNQESLHIKNLNWQRKGDSFELFFTSEQDLAAAVKIPVEKTALAYDAIITVGIMDTGKLPQLPAFSGAKIDYEKVIAINSSNLSNPQQNNYTLPEYSCSSVVSYKFAAAYQLPLDKEAATYLLAGIYWKTDSFRYPVTEEFAIAAELIKRKAVQKKAILLGLNNLSYSQLPYYQEIFVNLKTDFKGIYYSVISRKAKKTGQQFFRDLIPISEIYDARIAFVVLQDENFSTVYLKSNISDFNLAEFAKKYNGKGNHSQAYFISTMAAADLVNLLNSDLARQLKISKKEMGSDLTMGRDTSSAPIMKKNVNQVALKPEQNMLQKKKKIQEEQKPKTGNGKESPVINPLNKKPQEKYLADKKQRQNNNAKSVAAQNTANPVTEKTSDPLAPAVNMPQPLTFNNQGGN